MLFLAAALTAPPPVDFRRDVLPLLADHCFHCHGPDDKARQANYRLDTRDGAFKKKRDRTAIVPGKSGESELVRRVRSHDADELMPPPDSNRKLTAKQIETLTRWVDEGAVWGTHWAYEPLPKTVPVPAAPGTHPIDKFVRDRLLKEGLVAARPATREAWLRRVSLDLTGLPPTLGELDDFLADNGPAAFEKVVDRLLASPRYGERMAADWLDVARFADTHGYQSDRHRPMWAYRDWVIAAFNKNLPYDHFARDQLAGDLLPNATRDEKLATAFNRLHMQNEEGGVVEEEFRVAYVVDRVNTFGTAFLAQTLECSRCHDHKYDPLTQKDYYSLFAFFQNIDESGQTSYFTPAVPVPTLLLSTPEQDKLIEERRQAVADAERRLGQERERAAGPFAVWLQAPREKPAPHFGLTPGQLAYYSFDDWTKGDLPNDHQAIRSISAGKPHEGPKPAEGYAGRGVTLSGEDGFTFPGVGHFTKSDPFTFALWLKPADHAARAVVLHRSKAPIDAGSRGYELLLERGRVAFGMHHMWPGNSLKVSTKAAAPVDLWTHVAVTHDGSGTAAGVRIYLDGKPAETEVIRDGLWKDITYGGAEPDLTLGYRFRDNGFNGGSVDEIRIYGRSLAPLELAAVAGRKVFARTWESDPTKLKPAERDGLFEHFVSAVHAPTREATADLTAARKELSRAIDPIPEAMVMKEMPKPKPAFVLKRGNYDMPGDPVTATTPKVLPAFPPASPKNRLGLAQWLTDPDHPLFARVFVNRLWQQMFGTGLVETSDNFGTTGSPPTHPELLDWLARDFTSDYDVKRALKQIALSDTYRQSSTTTPDQKAKDPTNQYVARGPVRRLSAEMLRDQALFVSGLLAEKVGGPSVYPYQPEGLWNEAMGRPNYPQSKGPDLYRRGLYTYWKRTAPPPQMLSFDAADRSNCAARRQTTTTPLQALVLLNDPTFVEAGRKLGERILKVSGTAEGRLKWAVRTALNREPTAKELSVLTKLFDEQLAEYRKNPSAAERLLKVGESPVDAKLDAAELAAATSVAMALLNHDAAVHRR